MHYLYDKSRPDAIRIKVLFGDGTNREYLHRFAAQAEGDVIEAAKCHGWQDWLKIEIDEQKVTDRFASDTLIR